MKTVNGKEVTFGRLDASTLYKVEVVAIVGKYESLPTSMTSHTSPKPPHSLNFVNADLHSVAISWSPPNFGTGEIVKENLVKYSIMDLNGSRVMAGTQKIQSALKKSHIKVESLAQGTIYQFSVKV